MIRSPQRPAERRAGDILDAYLVERFGVGLEAVLLDSTYCRTTPGLAGAVTIEARCVSYSPHSDGGLDETFKGEMSVEGVSYRFRCCAYSVPDAYVARFLTDIAEFEAVDWTAAMPLDRARA